MGAADADETSFLARLRLTGGKAGIVGSQQRLVLAGFVVAAVVDHRLSGTVGETDLVRHACRWNEISAAYLGPIQAKLAGNPVEHPLHDERALLISCTTYGNDRWLVCAHDMHV